MRKQVKTKYDLGIIELKNCVYISDPCYKVGSDCQIFVESIKPGKYHCFMNKVNEEDWGIRVSDLWVAHENYKDIYPKTRCDAPIFVDSGAAGIYDKEYFEKYHTLGDKYIRDIPECKEWYDNQFNLRYNYDINGNEIKETWDSEKHCFVRTQDSRGGITLDNKCVITDSGIGDSTYPLFSYRTKRGEVVGLRINYL